MNETAWRFAILGYPVGFGAPEWLVLGVVAALVAALAVAMAYRRRVRVRALLGARLGPSIAPGAQVGPPAARGVLTGAGLLLFSMALDASKSMRARDVQPSRLLRAKLELSTLLDELKGDRVAIVAFAGDAFVQCPLTSDYAAAKLFLNPEILKPFRHRHRDFGRRLRGAGARGQGWVRLSQTLHKRLGTHIGFRIVDACKPA